MEYFSIVKTDLKSLMKDKTKLKGGYNFNQKIIITLYNHDLIKHILIKKLNNSLKGIINMILILNEESDDESANVVVAKLETLRKILLEKYSIYIGVKETENYLKRIEKLENKVCCRKQKKSMKR